MMMITVIVIVDDKNGWMMITMIVIIDDKNDWLMINVNDNNV